MSSTQAASVAAQDRVEHVDVLTVGAGISGIGAAYQQSPGKSLVVLDALPSRAGTWWTHTYPGVRSESDLFTFGYWFKPWRGPAIATSQEILHYLDEVISENGLDAYIRYQHRIIFASWSTKNRRWTVDVTRTDTGEALRFTTDFLWMCQGYHRHDQGYTPHWPGVERFQGSIVHPQTWPEELDFAGKCVVVIGSGSTAATLIPAIAETAAHVTMLQRSPTSFFAHPKTHELAGTLRALEVPDEWTHEILRRAYIAELNELTRMSFESPADLREFLIGAARDQLSADFDVDKHYNPTCRPWQQRVAVPPDGDLFASIRDGQASVVTDTIESFRESGIMLSSGERLEADIVVTAIGFDLSVFGEIALSVDERPVEFDKSATYRGLMFTGLPNLAYVFGYFRHSWTLRADLICDFVCRLLNQMQEQGATMIVPTLGDSDAGMALGPLGRPGELQPGLPVTLDASHAQAGRSGAVEPLA